MLRIHSISETSYSNLTYSFTNRKRKMNIVLLTFNLTDDSFLRRFNSHILKELKKMKLENVDENLREKTLKNFFVELNWQLFSKFNRLEDNYETGISLILLITVDDKIYFVEFGRMLSGVLKKGKFEYIGKNWENFFIKTKEELFLLGSRDEDIFAKIHFTEIDDKSLFITIPSFVVEQLKNNIDSSNLRRKIRYMYRKQKFPYVIFATKNFKIPSKESPVSKLWKNILKK